MLGNFQFLRQLRGEGDGEERALEKRLQRALRLFDDEGPIGHLSDAFDDLATRGIADGRRPTVLFIPELEGRAFWDEGLAGVFSVLRDAREDIRAEFLGLQASRCKPGHISKHASGSAWSQHYLIEEGGWHDDIARACPRTTAALRRLPLCETSLGYAYFSTLESKGHIRPHYGASNAKLRIQLPLFGDAGGEAAITVGGETRPYCAEPIAFDDTFPHSVHNSSACARTVLLLDVWHPQLTPAARQQLLAAFPPPPLEAVAVAPQKLPVACTARERRYLLRQLRVACGFRTTVHSADGTSTTVHARGRVRDLKVALELAGLQQGQIALPALAIQQLFVAGEEQPLGDDHELHRLTGDLYTGALDLFLLGRDMLREPVHWIAGEPAAEAEKLGLQLTPFSERSVNTGRGTHYHRLWKVLMTGSSGAGKTSFLMRFSEDEFHMIYTHTIGVDFKIRTAIHDGKVHKVQMWDTAGPERFRTITKSYYRGAHVVLVMFDIADRASFLEASHWFDECDRYAMESVIPILVGCKSDVRAGLLDGRSTVVTKEEAQALADAHGAKYFECSSKLGQGVQEAVDMAVRLASLRWPAVPVAVAVPEQPRARSFSGMVQQAGRRIFEKVLGTPNSSPAGGS
jgi:small GTP-binding protein